jgi:hypothetical protein
MGKTASKTAANYIKTASKIAAKLQQNRGKTSSKTVANYSKTSEKHQAEQQQTAAKQVKNFTCSYRDCNLPFPMNLQGFS